MDTIQQQLTDIYNQLSAINNILVNLASLTAVNTIQTSLQTSMDIVYNNIGVLNTQVQEMEITVSNILVSLRSS